jgi:regulator of cell morphogenesis and NO signaling
MVFMETTLTASRPTIGELVANDWRKAEVFKSYGIDYCCGGKRTVEEACARKGINPAVVESDLRRIDNRALSGTPNFKIWELDFLVDYIVNNHHKYVTAAIPFLRELSMKVARVHGDVHPELIEIDDYARQVTEELSMHMRKEEAILFPFIKKLALARRDGVTVQPPSFETIANPINEMEEEHLSAGEAMETIEKLSDQFTPPPNACMSYRVLFAKLQEFQQDLHQHVHLENNILFPKAIEIEKSVLRG